MKDETRRWLEYAEENLKSSQVLFESNLYNPCLQNVQQSIEKALKSLLVEHSIKVLKSHSISEIVGLLNQHNIRIDISKEDCELFDSVYLPSKYPLMSVLPDFIPDKAVCHKCILIAENVFKSVQKLL
ncbi:MAG: HEPN domain-containing protein [Planctomycetaceae bacterium]|nr:HEPN domain-containing protein [Planctomycetaceae bacterium]